MKKRTRALLAATILACGLLNGCSLILSRDYFEMTPHIEKRADDPENDKLRAETYGELKSGILSLVEEGTTEGTINLYNYEGNPENDARQACREAMKDEPLGVYAVDYMTFDCKTIFTYYQVTVSITYQKTREQIKSILRVNNATEFQDALLAAFAAFEPSLTAEIPYYYEDQYDIHNMLQSRVDEDPLNFVTPPAFTLNLYPDSEIQDKQSETAWQRIVEITFHYRHTAAELRTMTDAVNIRADQLTSEWPLPEDDIQKIVELQEIMIDEASCMSDAVTDQEDILKDDYYTAYGVLIVGKANSEGYALTFKGMCDRAGIDCTVVRGRLKGLLHCWNLVKLNDNWYHIDTALAEVPSTGLSYTLRTDAQMELTHSWNVSAYPAAIGPEIVFTEEAQAVFAAEVQEDTSGEGEASSSTGESGEAN